MTTEKLPEFIQLPFTEFKHLCNHLKRHRKNFDSLFYKYKRFECKRYQFEVIPHEHQKV